MLWMVSTVNLLEVLWLIESLGVPTILPQCKQVSIIIIKVQ